jgi:hypothetical protein
MVPPLRRLRRAASIVCYWRDGKLVFENYRTRVLISADPVVARLLHHQGGESARIGWNLRIGRLRCGRGHTSPGKRMGRLA